MTSRWITWPFSSRISTAYSTGVYALLGATSSASPESSSWARASISRVLAWRLLSTDSMRVRLSRKSERLPVMTTPTTSSSEMRATIRVHRDTGRSARRVGSANRQLPSAARSTYPMPRLVWIIGSPMTSILRRR